MPDRTLAGLKRYADQHVPTGDFLQAVLSNDLRGAFGRADDENLAALQAIVQYCHNELPSTCWGSPERYQAWISRANTGSPVKEDSTYGDSGAERDHVKDSGELGVEDAAEIATELGLDFEADNLAADLKQANELAWRGNRPQSAAALFTGYCQDYVHVRNAEDREYQRGMDDDRDDLDFADPGSGSALRAATEDDPRDQPCPDCGRENMLTGRDVALGYCCDRCADRNERGVD